MDIELKKPIVLVGMMGAGKTAIGKALARRLDVPFRDSDAALEEAASMSIAEIFARDGEAFFRDREAEGVSVWLKADLDLLWERVRHKDTRPLLRTPDPRATLAEIFAARTPVYALADLAVEAAPGLSIADMTEKVVAALAARPDVLGGKT